MSLLSAWVMASFKGRIDSVGNAGCTAKSVIRGIRIIGGDLMMMLEIDGHSDRTKFKAMPTLDQEILLAMDF